MRDKPVQHVLWISLACALVACGGDESAARDTTAAEASTSAGGSAPDSSRGATPERSSVPPAPASSSSAPPVAGRPACDRPVRVTYYARGGVPDQYIVTFGGMNGAPADSLIDALSRKHGFTASHRYQGAFSGFSARLPLTTLEAIRCEPAVTRISQVVIGGITPPAPTPPTGTEDQRRPTTD